MNQLTVPNELSRMLDNAFSKFDQDKSGKLNAEEFRSLYAMLKPGIATGADGNLQISEQDYQQRMDTDADGGVSRDEMQAAPILMPADLTDDSLNAMVEFLLTQNAADASAAARILQGGADNGSTEQAVGSS